MAALRCRHCMATAEASTNRRESGGPESGPARPVCSTITKLLHRSKDKTRIITWDGLTKKGECPTMSRKK